MMKAMVLIPVALVVAATATAQPAAAPAGQSDTVPLSGLWALGESRNCEQGPAWLFMADGYYVEVSLPNSGPTAVGLWRDEGNAIAYTHSHMPFADREKPNELKRLAIESRSPDLLVTRNYRGVARIFHRCPADALRAPDGQAAH
jgi:hypothetical protein